MNQLDKYMQYHKDELHFMQNAGARILRQKSLKKYYSSPNICEFCNFIIKVKIGQKVNEVRRKRFCSHSCAAKANNPSRIGNGKHPIHIYCEMCKKEKNNPYTRFCSQKCSFQYQEDQRLKKILETGILIGAPKTKRKFFKKIKPYICEICGQKPEWNGKSLTLTLDHINGHSEDNRLENFRWICPHCDTQLLTYGSKNKGNGRKKRYKNERE